MAYLPSNTATAAPLRLLYRLARHIVLPGFNGASLYVVGKFFVQEMNVLKLQERAAAVTYNFFMALPPTFLLLFSILPYLQFRNIEPTILGLVRLLSPNQGIYDNIHVVITDFMSKQHHDVLSYGIILVLFFASNGVMGLMRSFDKSLSLYVKRSALERRWTAMGLTVVILVILITGLAVLVLQSRDLNPYIHKMFHSVVAVKLVSFFILAFLVFIAISVIYTYGPSLQHKFRFFSTGSVFATIATVIATSVFFFLVNHFLNYNKIYGSIGTLIAFMVWLWINTLIILMGYLLNVSILLAELHYEENSRNL